MRWISHYCRSIVDPDGRPLGRRASNRDITDRKQAEEKVEALLKEKELLLREVHHRIKNNMISVASLLSMQAAKVRDPQAVEALTDAQRRLKSMGVLYDKLYRSDNLREMPVRVYLEPLLSEIVATFPSAAPVPIETDLDDFVLRAKTLLPLGIIVNEIVTNSLKYAFSDGRPGQFRRARPRPGRRPDGTDRRHGADRAGRGNEVHPRVRNSVRVAPPVSARPG